MLLMSHVLKNAIIFVMHPTDYTVPFFFSPYLQYECQQTNWKW